MEKTLLRRSIVQKIFKEQKSQISSHFINKNINFKHKFSFPT
jgi:hypothetical protein